MNEGDFLHAGIEIILEVLLDADTEVLQEVPLDADTDHHLDADTEALQEARLDVDTEALQEHHLEMNEGDFIHVDAGLPQEALQGQEMHVGDSLEALQRDADKFENI